MPEKKYLIEIPGMPDGSGVWDADKWERNKDSFMQDYPDANVFELGEYDAEDAQETDQIMLSFEDDEESSGIWDSAKWERNREEFLQDYPDARVDRVRYVDYWGQQAEANRARKAELSQPDTERDARLSSIGYYDDMSEEGERLDINNPLFSGLKPVSSAMKQNSVSGETEYLDPKVAEFYANDSAHTERMAELARLDAEYDANPSVIARREWEAQVLAERKAYADNLEKEIRANMESDVDAVKAARGGYAKRGYDPLESTQMSYLLDKIAGDEAGSGEAENEKFENYNTALKFLEKAKIARDVAGKGFWGATLDWAKEGVMDLATQDDIEVYNEIGGILSRLEKEVGSLKSENLTEDVFEKYLTQDEQALIKAFYEYNSAMAEAQRDMSTAYKGGKIFAESVPFMLEFLVTGGIYKGAGRAATSWMGKNFAKWIAKSAVKTTARKAKVATAKVVSGAIKGAVGTLARTTASPGTYDRVAEASIEIDDEGHLNPLKNSAVSFVDSYIENLSEISGGLIGKGLGIVGKGVGKLGKGAGQLIAKTPLSKIGSILADNKLMQGLSKFGKGVQDLMPKLEALGFHGLPEEVGEEFIGNTIREFTIQPGALEEMIEDDNFGAMLIGFAPMTLLGVGAGAYNLGVVNAKAAQLGKDLREKFSAAYSNEELDHMMATIQEAKTAEDIQKAIKPLARAVADSYRKGEITQEEAASQIETLYQYGGFMAQNNALVFGKKVQDRQLMDAKREEFTGRYGRFWQEDETETVQIATLNNGSTVFVTSAPAEDGKITTIDVTTGKKGFANISDIAIEEVEGEEVQSSNSMTMDAFLNGQLATQRKTAEETRMANERDAQIEALRSQVAPGTRINLGTEGSPVYVFAKGTNKRGVVIVDETGRESTLGWEQAADAMGQPIMVETDQQKLDAEISARLQRMAERRMRRSVQSPAGQATTEAAEQKAEEVEQEQTHIPLNEDGTVNEAAFWTQDPEGYVKWNDEQNKDGGQDSLRQIAISKQELMGMLAEVATGQNTSNPTMRKAAEKEVQIIAEKIARLEALEMSYADALAEEKVAVQKTAATPTVEMSEEQLEQMDAQYQGILGKTRVQSERVRVMQEYLDKISEESFPVVVLTRANYAEKMKAEGCDESRIKTVERYVKLGKTIGGFTSNGKLFLMEEGLPNINEARITYVHERQHVLNTQNPKYTKAIVNAVNGNREQLIAWVKAFVGEGMEAYETLTEEGLADELICRCMERAYTNEDFSVDLQSHGIPSEVISIITEIDNEQRSSTSLANARRRGRRNENEDFNIEGGIPEDGRNSEQVSGGVLGQEAARPSGSGDGGTQTGEGGESGEVDSEDSEPKGPSFRVTKPEDNLSEETVEELADKGLVMDGGAIMSEDYAALKHELGYETPIERNTDLDDLRFSYGTRHAHIANYLQHPEAEQRVVALLERLAERMSMNELVFGVISKATGHTYGKKMPGSVAGPLRSNVEYVITFDLDTSCPRTFQYLNLVKKIERRIGRPLTQTESIQLIEMMRMYGQQIPCVYCYAENKRQALKQYYSDFIEARHGVLSAATDEEALEYMYGHTKEKSNDPKVALTDAAYNVFVEWRKNPRGMYNPTIKMLWNQYTNDRNSVLTLLDTMLADKGISIDVSDAKIAASVAAEFGVTNTKAIKVIEEIVGEWKWDVIEGKEHDQFTPVEEDDLGVNERAFEVWRDMTSYAKSASSAKSVIRYTPYTDELKAITQEQKDYINGMGGVRMHSSNDFRIDYVYDYFQFMADMALYKMFGHTYTKSPEFVRIFGNSGYKINMSIAAYQDENGNIRPNVDEGFDWEEAKTLRQLFPNAGTMLMATSDEQIQMALDSDWIDMCIPFHHSGLPKAVWGNMRLWSDYTSIQKELFLNGTERKEALKAAGVMIPKKAKADEIEELYNEHFGVKVIFDKKGKRIKPHFLPGPTIVDGHVIPGHNNDHQTYLDLCREYGVKPRFAGMQVKDNTPEGGGRVVDITEHPRYMIFIKETSRTDSPQTAIQFNFDEPSEALGGKTPMEYAFDELEARAMAESELEGGPVSDIYSSLDKDQFGIVDQFINSVIKHKQETGEDYPLDYITPESREWFLVQRKALEEAFKDVETIPYHRNEYDEQGNLTKGQGLEAIDLVAEAKKAQKKHDAKKKKSKKDGVSFRVISQEKYDEATRRVLDMANQTYFKRMEGEYELGKLADNYAELADLINVINEHKIYRPVGSSILGFFANNPSMHFPLLLNEKSTSKEAAKALEEELAKIDDVNALTFMKDAWRIHKDALEQAGLGIKPSATTKYNKAIDKRIEDIKAADVKGTAYNFKKQESSLDEIDAVFKELNKDADLALLHDKVLDLARTLGVKVSFAGKRGSTAGESLGDKVSYDYKYFNSPAIPDQNKCQTITHELIHSVTTYAIYISDKAPGMLTDGMLEAVGILRDVYGQIAKDAAFKGEYGVTDVYEMVAELSNAKFRDKLKEKNLFQRILDALKRLLGIDTVKEDSAYQVLSDTLDYIIDNYDQTAFDAYANYASRSRSYGRMMQIEEAPSFRITAEQDKAYIDAVEAGDMETAQRMVDEAARAAGYDSPKLYHGTRNFGFTKIDSSKSDDGLSFFTTESPIIAQTYSGVKGERRINEAMGEVDRKKLAEPYEEEANEYLLEHTRELAEWLNIEGRGIDIDEFATRVTDMFYDLEEWAIQEKKNSLDVLIHTIKTYDTILEEYYDKEKYASVEEQIKADDGTWDARLEVAKAIGKYVDVMNGEGSFGNYSFYANTWAMLEVECNGSNWDNIKSADLPYRGGRAWNTRAVAKYAKEEGWLGVVYKNLTDLGPRAEVAEWQRNTNIYNFFRPQQQVKSADPVTYDNDGNVIPLSERFNPGDDDIRFRVLDTSKAELKDKPIKINGMYRFNLKNAFKGVKDNGGSYPYIKVQLEEVPEDYSGKKIIYNGILEGFAVVRIPKGLITEGEKDNVFFIDPKAIENELWDVLRATEDYYEFKHGNAPYQRDWMNAEGVRFSVRSDEQREKLFADAKNQYGVTDNFNAAGYMLPDGSLLDFSEANDGGDPNSRSLDHRDIEGVIMDNGVEYDSRWMYIADFMNEGAIRLLPESAGINLIKAPSAEQRKRLLDFIYRHNGEVILEIVDERLNSAVYMEYDRRTSPSRIFRDIDGYFNDGIVPQQDIRFRMSNENQAMFVSNAARVVEGIKQEKATPEQWLKMIEKNGGLKAGEDKWMGLSDWLKASDKKTLTKQEVLDFINENMIVIEETHYDANAEDDAERVHGEISENLQDRFDHYIDEYYQDKEWDDDSTDEAREYAIEKLREEMGDTFPYTIEREYGSVYLTFPYEEESDLIEWAKKTGVEYTPGVNPINETRLGYTTSGLANRHEIALTVPTIEGWKANDAVHFGDAGDGRAVAWIRFGETWEQRPSPQISRKVLVIDEIQSKRHQEGREKGYMPNLEKEYERKEAISLAAEDAYFNYIKETYNISIGTASQSEIESLRAKDTKLQDLWEVMQDARGDLKDVGRRQAEQLSDLRIPDAPFDKNWHELAMKRMLRYAAENGYDVIAWTKGEQQAERYSLSKSFNSIEREDRPDGEGGRRFVFYGGHVDTIYVNESGVVTSSSMSDEIKGKHLSEVVGKDMAARMMSLEDNDTIDGENLKIGGEGMKGFYDKMLPAFMNKYGKKWGIKVEDITLPNVEEAGRIMHSVPVTEEMKASVMEGQVMFRMRGENESAMEFHQSVVDEHLRKYNDIAAMEVFPVDEATAKKFGYTLDQLKKLSGLYDSSEDLIAIFAKEEETDSIEVEDTIFHESVHKLVDFFDYLKEVGEWMWSVADKYKVFADIKKHIEQKYSESEYAEEMMCFMLGGVMPRGLADDLLYGMPEHIRKQCEQIFNEIGYDSTRESIARLLGPDGKPALVSSVASEASGEDEGRRRNEKRELTSKERRVINEYFPGAFPEEENDTQLDNTGEYSEGESDIRFSIRTKPAPKKTGKGYKVFYLKDGKLYPPMVANLGGVETPVGVWLDAEEGTRAGVSKTGRPQVKQGGKGTQGGSGTLAYRPGWHLGEIPYAIQFNRKDENGDRTLFPADFVWAEVEYANDVDYQEEAMSYGMNANGKFQHSLAGLPKLPTDGSYRYRTNPNPETDPWIITGAMKVNRLLTPSEVDQMVVDAGREPQKRQEGAVADAQIKALNKELGLVEEEEEVSFRITGTPTEDVVARGLDITPAQTARLAGNIFAALPEESRKKITEGLNGNILNLQEAILQIPTSLATKENWNDEDRQMASVVREMVQEMVDAIGATSRPLTAKEALWMLYDAISPVTDLVSAASRAFVAHNLGFDQASMQRKKDVDDYIRFSIANQGAIDAATDMYNYETTLWTERLKESWLDMNQSVVSLQNALADATGMPIEPWENIEYALNRLSSKSYSQKKTYLRDFLMPLWDSVMDIIKSTDFKIEDIERYMMLKHALERNVVFAKRDAREFYRGMYDEVARKIKSQSHAEQVVELSEAKKALADIDAQIATATGAKLQRLKDERANAQYRVDVAELVLRGDEKQNEDDLQNYYDAIDAEIDPKYLELREKDYGGLTSMYTTSASINRSNYKSEEAYQKAVLANQQPIYDNVADMESAARMEVDNYERLFNPGLRTSLWNKVNAATKETLRHQYESGMLTVEQYEAVRDMFKFYVPLRGFADNTAEDMYSYYMNNSSGGFSMPVIGAKGRKTRAESPLGWIGTMAESAIQADNKNEAKMCLYYMVLRRPDQNLLSLTETWFEYTGKKDANGKKIYAPAYPPATTKALNADELRQHMEDWEDDMKKKQASGDAFKGTQSVNLRGSVIFQEDKQEKEHIIRVKVAGKDYSILVNGNPRAAQAINSLLNPDANVSPAGQWIGEIRRQLSSLLTSYSPLFWVSNYQRDLLASVMRVSEADGWDAAMKYLANRRKAWRVASYIYKYDAGELGDSYYEKLYKEFAENGGITGYTSLTTNKEYDKILQDYAKNVDREFLNAIKGMWDKFMGFGEAIEQVSRFAAFITAREDGKPIEEAINAAKEVSVNFNRKGSAQPITMEELDKLRTKDGKKLNTAQKGTALILSAMPGPMKFCYFFFNASIQALSSSAKLAKKSPGKASTWVGLYMGASIAMAMMNYLLSGDDEDEYLDLPDYLRQSNLLIPVADGYYFKWSLPQEMRPFYAWADILVRKMMGKMPHENAKDVGKELALATSQWLPVNPFDAEDPLLALVPDFATPFAEVRANKNFFGGKIYDDMSFRPSGVVEEIPAYRKATEKTGKAYVDIAKFLNDISGGDEVIKGNIDINPAVIEHLVEGYGGGIYDFAKMMVALPSLLLSDEGVEIRDIPFLNKVIMSVDETNMYSHTNEAFYHYRDVANNAKRVEKEYRESDDPSRADAYREEEDWRIYLLYKQYEADFESVKERLDEAVDETEEDLLKQEQNVLREMFLNDIAKGELPEITYEIREGVKRIEKEVKKIMKPVSDANKERLERKKVGDVDGMLEAIEKRDSLKETPEYMKAESINSDLKEIKKMINSLGSVSRGSQRDSVIGELQKNYDKLKEDFSEL